MTNISRLYVRFERIFFLKKIDIVSFKVTKAWRSRFFFLPCEIDSERLCAFSIFPISSFPDRIRMIGILTDSIQNPPLGFRESGVSIPFLARSNFHVWVSARNAGLNHNKFKWKSMETFRYPQLIYTTSAKFRPFYDKQSFSRFSESGYRTIRYASVQW